VNVKEGTRRLALVAGLLGSCVGIIPARDSFLDLRREVSQRKEFDSLIGSEAFNEGFRNLLQSSQSPQPSLAAEIRSTFPKAYEDLSDSEIEQKFSAKVRESEGPWEEHTSSPAVKVRGPDGRLYLFPPGTTKDIAVAYFKKKWANIRPIPGSTTPVNAGNIKSVTWANNDFAVSYIETQDGRTLYNRQARSHWLFLLYACYPLIGFFLPWGAIRAAGWVILGFQRE
jgi:hypothetical protein